MSYAVLANCVDELTRSETFGDLASAVQTYRDWVQSYGASEQKTHFWSSYVDHGSHITRVSVVFEPNDLKAKLERDNNSATIWKHVVPVKHKAEQLLTKYNYPSAKSKMQPSKRSQRRLLLRRKNSTTNTMRGRLEFSEFDEMGEPVYLVKALPRAVEVALGGLVLAKYVRDEQLNLVVLDDDFYQVERAFFEAFEEDQVGEPRVSSDYLAFVKKYLYASGKDVATIIQKYDNLDSERSRLAKAKWVSLLGFLKVGNTTKAEELLLDMSATSTY